MIDSPASVVSFDAYVRHSSAEEDSSAGIQPAYREQGTRTVLQLPSWLSSVPGKKPLIGSHVDALTYFD